MTAAAPARAQPVFDELSRATGLPSDYVLAIHQDRQGFVWFGTDSGVARYDGRRVETFTTDEGHFELCARLITNRGISMSRQAIAKHLAVMRDAGLIEVSSVGRTTVHTLNRDALLRAAGWLSAFADQEGKS